MIPFFFLRSEFLKQYVNPVVIGFFSRDCKKNVDYAEVGGNEETFFLHCTRTRIRMRNLLVIFIVLESRERPWKITCQLCMCSICEIDENLSIAQPQVPKISPTRKKKPKSFAEPCKSYKLFDYVISQFIIFFLYSYAIALTDCLVKSFGFANFRGGVTGRRAIFLRSWSRRSSHSIDEWKLKRIIFGVWKIRTMRSRNVLRYTMYDVRVRSMRVCVKRVHFLMCVAVLARTWNVFV